MISFGGQIGLLCLAVVGLIMSERRWVKILSGLYFSLCAIGIVIEVVRGHSPPSYLIVPLLLLLLAMYVHSVEHMFDAKKRPRST